MKTITQRLSAFLAALLLTLGYSHAAERFDSTAPAHVVAEGEMHSAPLCAPPCTGTGDEL